MQKQLHDFFKNNQYSSCIVLSDANVFSLHGKSILNQLQSISIPHFHHTLPPGESIKTLSSAESCWHYMHLKGLDRFSLVIGLGGGAITDLAGFVASCYMRGIDTLYLPTTLLGMVDASIGGKTAVNLPTGKNIVGTFHQPKKIIVSLEFLHSLPKKEFVSGLAEVIKCAVIDDPNLFEFLKDKMDQILHLNDSSLSFIIERTQKIKQHIVEKDFKESSQRQILNYGHTFGHAIEAATNYKAYTHGEAVAIGMSCAAQASLLLGLVDDTFVQQQNALCTQAGLPTQLPQSISAEQILQYMRKDKKTNAGEITLILPENIGKVGIYPKIPSSIILKAIRNNQGKDHE